MPRFGPLVLLAASSCACGVVSFERKKTIEVVALEASARGYYEEVARAFLAGDPGSLAALFSPTISKPMTRPQILAWGKKFFGEHGSARFVVERLELDELGTRRAVARLTYRVVTHSGIGGFSGTERDVLERPDGGRWTMTEWTKL